MIIIRCVVFTVADFAMRARRCVHLITLTALGTTPFGCGLVHIRMAADDAVAAWARRTGETDPCRYDAMQHCIGGSSAAARCGPACAELLGVLLEVYQGDGDPMDLANNHVGAQCALPITQDADGAVACCEKLLRAEPSPLRTDGRCD